MGKTTTNLDYFKRKNIKIIQKPKLMIHKKKQPLVLMSQFLKMLKKILKKLKSMKLISIHWYFVNIE
jgi:hypothetical protein